MTTQTISHNTSADHLRRSVLVDLMGWTGIGAVLTAASGPLADLLGVAGSGLLAIGLALLMGAPLSLWLLERKVGYSRKLVGWFAALNVDAGVLLWLALLAGWLPVDGALWWALASVADLCLLFGIVQFLAWWKG